MPNTVAFDIANNVRTDKPDNLPSNSVPHASANRFSYRSADFISHIISNGSNGTHSFPDFGADVCNVRMRRSLVWRQLRW